MTIFYMEVIRLDPGSSDAPIMDIFVDTFYQTRISYHGQVLGLWGKKVLLLAQAPHLVRHCIKSTATCKAIRTILIST